MRALQALALASAARTKAARLRELLPEIEAAQAAGVKHEHIVQTLNAHGFALSMKSYSVMAAPPAPSAGQKWRGAAAHCPGTTHDRKSFRRTKPASRSCGQHNRTQTWRAAKIQLG